MKREVKRFVAIVAVVIASAVLSIVTPSAQEKSPVPLTVEQRQAIQIKAQEMTIAQLQYEKARAELTALMQSLQKDGFDLNLQTGEYTKKPEPAKK